MEDANFKDKQDSGLIALFFSLFEQFKLENLFYWSTFYNKKPHLMIMFENKVSLFDAIQIIIY